MNSNLSYKFNISLLLIFLSIYSIPISNNRNLFFKRNTFFSSLFNSSLLFKFLVY